MRCNIKSFGLWILYIFLTSLSSWAQEPTKALIYGPEWTFTSPEIVKGATFETYDTIKQKFRKSVEAYCRASGKCHADNLSQGIRKIQFENQVTVFISRDEGVFEVQATPLTLEKWQEQEKIFQLAIFNSMKSAGQIPHERIGGGHLNIGLAFFLDKPLLLRNFIVDFYNHPGLGVVLNSLSENAAYSAYLDQASKLQKDHFIKQLALLDQIKNPDFFDVVYHLGQALQNQMLALTIKNFDDNSDIVPEKMSRASFKKQFKISPTLRMEIRALRPQANMSSFVQVMQIFDSKIETLASIKKPIALQKPKPIIDGWKALGQFADYLESSGLDWKNYRNLMPKLWQNLPEENFIRGQVKIPQKKICRRLFF